MKRYLLILSYCVFSLTCLGQNARFMKKNAAAENRIAPISNTTNPSSSTVAPPNYAVGKKHYSGAIQNNRLTLESGTNSSSAATPASTKETLPIAGKKVSANRKHIVLSKLEETTTTPK